MSLVHSYFVKQNLHIVYPELSRDFTMDEESDSKMKSTKAMIRSVLISEKNGVPASRFLGEFL